MCPVVPALYIVIELSCVNLKSLPAVLIGPLMIIPPSGLSPETLQSILEEFITREGTDYGALEQALEQKVAALKAQIVNGQVVIVFDESSETVNLVSKDEYSE